MKIVGRFFNLIMSLKFFEWFVYKDDNDFSGWTRAEWIMKSADKCGKLDISM